MLADVAHERQPYLLAFDTATERMAVAVGVPGRVFTRVAQGGAAASATLLPTLRALLTEAGHTLADVTAIGFGRGPGAFTGLRTSAAVAQGLAFGIGVPVLPIDSLLIVAEDARAALAGGAGGGASFDVGVAMDARMGEVYAGRYRFDGTRWLTTEVHALWAPEAVAAAWADSAAPHCVAGTALTAFEGRVAWPATARQVPAEADRAAALWRLVQAAWQAGEAVDAALALPVYLRDKVAFTTSEREAARAAKNA